MKVLASGILLLFFGYLVALYGKNRNIGFWGAYLGSIVFSPLLGLLFAFLSGKVTKTIVYKCKSCNFKYTTKSDFCPGCGKENISKIRMDNKQIGNNEQDI